MIKLVKVRSIIYLFLENIYKIKIIYIVLNLLIIPFTIYYVNNILICVIIFTIISLFPLWIILRHVTLMLNMINSYNILNEYLELKKHPTDKVAFNTLSKDQSEHNSNNWEKIIIDLNDPLTSKLNDEIISSWSYSTKLLKIKLGVLSINSKHTLSVKKIFNSKFRFYREILSLLKLEIKNLDISPKILHLDTKKLTCYLEYIDGETLEQIRLKRKKDLTNISVKTNILDYNKNILMSELLGDELIDNIYSALTNIHLAGITIRDINYANIIYSDKKNQFYFIDFESSAIFSNLKSFEFLMRRNENMNKFNKLFYKNKISLNNIDEKIKSFNPKGNFDVWYSSVYFGKGYIAGGRNMIDSGSKKWRYILKNKLGDIKNKRVLDLGCNNGVILLEMLRAGIFEGVGIEFNKYYYGQGDFIKNTFEWFDCKKYNFILHNCNILDIEKLELGNFDITMGLNSLYYLDPSQLIEVLNYISTITKKLVIECRIGTPFSSQSLNQRASVSYMIKALKTTGYYIEYVEKPKFHLRPLIIAST